MNVIVRFYWQHDLDLVALNMHPDFDMGRQMKRAITAYARNDLDYSIPLPRSMPYSVELDNCCTHFRLSPEKDADVIEFLNGFRSGFRNSAIKIIFRQFLHGIYIDPYFNQQTYLTKSRCHANTEKAPKVDISRMKQQNPQQVPKEKAKRKVRQVEPLVKDKHPDSESKVPVIEESTIDTEINSPVEDKYADDISQNDDDFDVFGAINLMMK